MSPKPSDVPYGTLDLMVLTTVATTGRLHGYGIEVDTRALHG